MAKSISDIVGMGIDDTNNLVFAWYADGEVTAGSSTDLSSKRKPAPYKLPSGKTARDIAAMGIDGTNNFCFAWYRDGTVSAGSSTNLGAERPPERYLLPAGKTPNDVIEMGIDGLALDKAPAHLLELGGAILNLDPKGIFEALTGSDDVLKSLVFAWYRDGTVSAGSSKELAKVRPGSPFTI
jgi:hypothetical protein